MKVLLIADDDNVIEKINSTLVDNGFDVITYRWLLKALDNIEEIAPEVIVISASSYPRHWKTLVQYVQSGISGVIPKVILYTERKFSDDDFHKSEVLNIYGIFNSIEKDGLDELASLLTEKKKINYSLIFTNPDSGAFITGKVSDYSENEITFIPDNNSFISQLKENSLIKEATLKSQNSIKYITAKLLSKENNNTKVKLQVI